MLLSFLRELLVPFEFPEVIAQLEIFMFSRLQAVLRGIKFFSQRTRTFKKKKKIRAPVNAVGSKKLRKHQSGLRYDPTRNFDFVLLHR
jgi:hypothetical protein